MASKEVKAQGHHERFDVITSPDGSSSLSFDLACATAFEHYQKTTTASASTLPTAVSTLEKSAGGTHEGTNNEQGANNNGISGQEEVCSTGLRVYEGAQVLSALLCQYGLALAPLGEGDAQQDSGNDHLNHHRDPRLVVELGCGCGLVGFTASTVLNAIPSSASTTPMNDVSARAHRNNGAERVKVIFTDASESCLQLVRQTGELNQLPVLDGQQRMQLERAKESEKGEAMGDRFTFPLPWSPEGVQKLQCNFLKLFQRQSRSPLSTLHAVNAGLVLGSDIMYYRVDIHALLCTVKQLLQGDRGNHGDTLRNHSGKDSGPSGFCVLSHVMRIANGRRTLALQARRLGFGLAEVPLSAFLAVESVVLERGWGGLEVVILYLKGSENYPMHHSGEQTIDDETEKEAALAAFEVAEVKARLTARWRTAAERGSASAGKDADNNTETATPPHASPLSPQMMIESVRQADALSRVLAPYIYSNAEADASVTKGRHGKETAEEEFLHLLL